MKYYVQTTGNFYIDKTLLFTGYAGGDCGAFPEGVNNTEFQYGHNKGPLPCSTYTIGEPEHHPKLGRGTMVLTPLHPEELHGRAAFAIHGIKIGTTMADRSSSDGCICAEPYITRIKAFTPDGDNTLTVVSEESELSWNNQSQLQ